MNRSKLGWINCVFALSFCSTQCFGQAGRAELFGTIRDPMGLAVPGAKVEAESQDTKLRYPATSNEQGEYHLLGLPAGTYTLTVEAKGFRTLHQSGVTLRIGDRTQLSPKLLVGEANDSVEVIAQAPLLQTASGAVTYSVDIISLGYRLTAVFTSPCYGFTIIPG